MLNVDAYGHEQEFVRDLRRLLERLIAPIGEAIERYAWVHARVFAALEAELGFYLNAADLMERLQRTGLPVCRPRIAPSDDRLTEIEDGYNAALALRMGADAGEMVTSDIRFDDEARVWILTGPNRGGKTTYIRAAGIAQVLFQAGLHVPARSARLSPVDAIHTHFPSREGATPGEGRLDDEAKRLAGIFAAATPHSLILLNEVLSGTSTLEALGLARDALRGLHLLGARTIYVTHLHDLTAAIDDINRDTEGDGVVGSLVAEIDDRPEVEDMARRTFRVHPGRPRGHSYASDIAEQHGISYAQVRRLLKERGVLPDEA
jgi:DNA mismatch repair ATPase MutS